MQGIYYQHLAIDAAENEIGLGNIDKEKIEKLMQEYTGAKRNNQ